MTDLKTEDLWLMKGDCLERMKEIPDGSVDMILTDPPYGTTACKWDSIIPLEPMWEQLKRIIKTNGAIVMTASQPFTSILTCSNLGMYKYSWVWEKNKCGNYMAAKYQPMKYHEDIVVFSNGGVNTRSKHPVPYFPVGIVGCNISKKGKDIPREGLNTYHNLGKAHTQKATNYPKSIIEVNCDKGTVHPTQKPVALMEYLIKTYTNEGETVLDFASGSFTTGVACVNLNRKFIGIEMDDYYFELGKERIL
mgnify:CR=1 FL=1